MTTSSFFCKFYFWIIPLLWKISFYATSDVFNKKINFFNQMECCRQGWKFRSGHRSWPGYFCPMTSHLKFRNTQTEHSSVFFSLTSDNITAQLGIYFSSPDSLVLPCNKLIAIWTVRVNCLQGTHRFHGINRFKHSSSNGWSLLHIIEWPSSFIGSHLKYWLHCYMAANKEFLCGYYLGWVKNDQTSVWVECS